MSTDNLMTADEVAAVLGVTTRTLANWRRDGDPDLPFLTIGGRIRYRESDVDDFLAEAESADEDEIEECDED